MLPIYFVSAGSSSGRGGGCEKNSDVVSGGMKAGLWCRLVSCLKCIMNVFVFHSGNLFEMSPIRKKIWKCCLLFLKIGEQALILGV